MVSQNERARWERAWEQSQARMDRQKHIITRLVGINTEAMAALEEIADPEGAPPRERAREALARIKGSAAATAVQEAESYEDETPVEDPRRNPG